MWIWLLPVHLIDWGLRDYGIEPQIWGGKKGCDHIWGPGSSGHFCEFCNAWRGCLGLEPHPLLYIEHLIMIFKEIKRVLKKSGSFYLNMGDSYYGSHGGTGTDLDKCKEVYVAPYEVTKLKHKIKSNWLQPKQLLGIPERIMIAMQEDGWILRNKNIWYKRNPMPSSVKDRRNNVWEYLYWFTKNNKTLYWTNPVTKECVHKQPLGIEGKEGIDWVWKKTFVANEDTFKVRVSDIEEDSLFEIYRNGKFEFKKQTLWDGHDYYYDLDAIRVPHTCIGVTDMRPAGILRQKLYDGSEYHKSNDPHLKQYQRNKTIDESYKIGGMRNAPEPGEPNAFNVAGKNPGDVIHLSTQPFPEAHFATFPEDLVRDPILSSCPEYVCVKCGKARTRVVSEPLYGIGKTNTKATEKTEPNIKHLAERRQYYRSLGLESPPKPQTIGWTKCDCNAEFVGGIVLDPFCGSGTVGKVAIELNRQFIIIDIKKEYCDMSEKRIVEAYDKKRQIELKI